MSAITLQGAEAFKQLDLVLDKLNAAASMASILNTAAFAKGVELSQEALQDYTNRLSVLVSEVRGAVTKWELAKE